MTFESQTVSTTAALDQESIAALSRGLHQAAQPLTALQGWLELALIGSHTEDEYKSSIRHAIEESHRVLTCFNHLRELARVPDAASGFAVSAMIRAVLDRFEGDFDAAGVDVVVDSLPPRSGVDDFVRVSESRVSTALSLVLSSSLSFLESGDRLQLSMMSEPERVEICVLVRKRHPIVRASRTELNGRTAPLELAQALIVGIGGKVTLGPSAFSVWLSLPKMPAMSQSCDAAQTRCVHV